MPTETRDNELGNEDWFREPTRREHGIAGALFVGFGLFFLTLFFVLSGWWVRWVVVGLGVISIARGAWHALIAIVWHGDIRHE